MSDKPKYPPPTEPCFQWYEDQQGNRGVVKVDWLGGILVADGRMVQNWGVAHMNGTWGPRVPEPEDWP